MDLMGLFNPVLLLIIVCNSCGKLIGYGAPQQDKAVKMMSPLFCSVRCARMAGVAG